MSEDFGYWLRRLDDFVHSESIRLGWEQAIRDGNPRVLQSLEESVRRFIKAHPPAGLQFPSGVRRTPMPLRPGHLPAHFPAHLKKAEQLAEEARLAKQASGAREAIALSRIPSARRNIRGGATIVGMLIGLGTGGAGFLASKAGQVFLAKFFARWYIEDKIVEIGVAKLVPLITAIEEASLPNNVHDAENLYQAYLRGRHIRSYNRKTAEYFEWDSPSPPLNREDWLAETYGLRWDALSP